MRAYNANDGDADYFLVAENIKDAIAVMVEHFDETGVWEDVEEFSVNPIPEKRMDEIVVFNEDDSVTRTLKECVEMYGRGILGYSEL